MTGSDAIIGRARSWLARAEPMIPPSFEESTSLVHDLIGRITRLESKLRASDAEFHRVGKALSRCNAIDGIVHQDLADVWIFQGDGSDDPSSLVCPVVMEADTLRDLLEQRSGEQRQLPQDRVEHLLRCERALTKLGPVGDRALCEEP